MIYTATYVGTDRKSRCELLAVKTSLKALRKEIVRIEGGKPAEKHCDFIWYKWVGDVCKVIVSTKDSCEVEAIYNVKRWK